MKIKMLSLIFAVCLCLGFACNDSSAYYYPNNCLHSSGENYLQITQIERALFNNSYENENIYSRLNRIEQKLFRTTNNSANLADRLETIMNNINPSMLANIPSSELGLMEREILNRTFAGETPDKRIARLEQTLFGTMQSGSIEERFYKLRNSIASRKQYDSSYTAYGLNPNGKVRNTLYNLLGGLGTITGITTPVYDPFDSNTSFFYPNSYSQFYRNNTGLYNYLNNFGTTNSVRILE